jgi:hypothetical protein
LYGYNLVNLQHKYNELCSDYDKLSKYILFHEFY